MTTAEFIASMEQFKQNGGDMNAVGTAYQSLTATGKTPLGLNQWQKSDKPTMDDFNSDNKLIDDSIRELQAKKVNKIAPQEYDIPLADGIGYFGVSKYAKSQENIVTINARLKANNNQTLNDLLLSVLPQGFRPSFPLEIPAIYHNPMMSGLIKINPDGTIKARIDGATTQFIVMFTATYVAAQ